MNFLECKVCMLPFTNERKPCVFKCGHGCCEICFDKLKSDISGEKACHLCRIEKIEKNINQAIFDIYKEAETYFSTYSQRKYLSSFCKIVPQISSYICDATKQLKNYLSKFEMPNDVLELLIIQSKHDDDFINSISFENLCVTSKPVFIIKSESEDVVQKNDIATHPNFIYERYFSVGNNGERWRNYYRRHIEYADNMSELMKEALLNNFFEKEFCAYIALSKDNECLLNKKPIGCIFWIIEPTLTKFKPGQLVKLLQMPPKEFKGSFKKTPIIYSEEYECHIIDYPNGFYKLQGKFKEILFKVKSTENKNVRVSYMSTDGINGDHYEFNEEILALPDD